jgi:hypothetical protein
MQCKWEYEKMIDDNDLYILYTVMRKHKDAYNYYPLAVAKRTEIGLSYRFLCIAVPKANSDYVSHLAVIGIYKPPTGAAYATCVYRQEFDQIFPY